MATLITTPPAVAFANNLLQVVTESAHMTPNQEAYILVEYAVAAGPSSGDSFDIVINTIIYTFTFASSPANIYEIATKGSMTESQYFAYLAEYFRSHPIMSELFSTVILTDAGTFRFKLIWRKIEVVALSITLHTLINLTVTAHPITAISNVENLTAFLSVTDADTQQIIIQKIGNYDVQSARCTFKISEAFQDLAATLPDPSVFAPTIAADSFRHYYIRYADRFGYPAQTEARAKSTVKTVIAGGTSSGLDSPFFLQSVYALHPAANEPKLVTYRQPDWLYLCSPLDLIDVFYDILIYLDDNTSFVHNPEVTFEMKKGEVQYIASGFRQLLLHTLTIPTGKTIIGYDVRMQHASTGVFHIHSYELDAFTRHPWNLYILMDNGLGGMETVRLKGKRQLKYTADVITAENESGELSTAFAEGIETIDVSTGYYNLEYIQTLRQLMLGRLFLVSIKPFSTYTFTKIIADTKSADIIPDDNDLHALIFAFKKAKTEKQHNTF